VFVGVSVMGNGVFVTLGVGDRVNVAVRVGVNVGGGGGQPVS
jgi:hypothetical protein